MPHKIRYRRAKTSAARTCGFLVLALRRVRIRLASLNPAARNSLRKAPPSFAPAIQANQSASLCLISTGRGFARINSAA